MEIISTEGYRLDGRKASEIRSTLLRYRSVGNQTCLELEQGCTKVTTLLSGMKARPKHKNKLNISIFFLDVSREEKGKNTDKARDLEKVVTDVFLKTLILPPGASLDVDATVKQDDGSLLTTIINCISLNACYSGVPMKDIVVGMTIGFVSNTFFVDICGVEENYKYPHMSTVLAVHGRKVVYLHLLGKVEHRGFEDMFRHGYEASGKLFSEFSIFLNRPE